MLGRVDYANALELQMRICEAKRQSFENDALLLLEHPPTITIGRNGKRDHLLVPDDELKRRGVNWFEVDRGGDITFHGPGQLVGYPILKLEPGERDVHRFMRNLEGVLIELLSDYAIDATREGGFTGVWTREGKIAAMGIHISRWITRHGFALNVNTDLSFYDLIIPCGLTGKSVTSMERVLGMQCDLAEVAERFIAVFGEVFGRRMLRIPASELLDRLRIYEQHIPIAGAKA